jgi:hypothetical protein
MEWIIVGERILVDMEKKRKVKAGKKRSIHGETGVGNRHAEGERS